MPSSVAVTIGIVCLPLPVLAETELVMVEQAGCAWCARWNAQVSPAYPLTKEGARAPLRRIDQHAPLPDDLAVASRPRPTPTFTLATEVARMEGYASDEFFWVLLSGIMTRAQSADCAAPD